MAPVDFDGKRIVQRTSAGTQGIVVAGNRAVYAFYAALLVTAEAAIRAFLSGLPDQPEPEKHPYAGRLPMVGQFFDSTLLRQSAVSADREHKKQPPEPGMRHRTWHDEELVFSLKPEARLAGALVEFHPRHTLIP